MSESWSTATGDGRRSVARARPYGSPGRGRQVANLLRWCDEVGVEVVTIWFLSPDNLIPLGDELEPLLTIIEKTVEDLAATQRWRIHPVGALDLLPPQTAQRLKEAEDATRDVDGMLVNVAVGYGGRREIADAVRALLHEHAAKGTTRSRSWPTCSTVDHIAQHLYTKGQPDPDLVIRTSGEQRLGGFLLWQSAQSEFYFCEALLAGLPARRLPARAARLRRAQPPVRQLSGAQALVSWRRQGRDDVGPRRPSCRPEHPARRRPSRHGPARRPAGRSGGVRG